ncbi:MAG: hypothetical protein HOV67_20115 [Kribbellaceae bacterium]|nr:hypothetical protein [Kribbellaceae bacterium]
MDASAEWSSATRSTRGRVLVLRLRRAPRPTCGLVEDLVMDEANGPYAVVAG